MGPVIGVDMPSASPDLTPQATVANVGRNRFIAHSWYVAADTHRWKLGFETAQ
jgi:hypothetical protein